MRTQVDTATDPASIALGRCYRLLLELAAERRQQTSDGESRTVAEQHAGQSEDQLVEPLPTPGAEGTAHAC